MHSVLKKFHVNDCYKILKNISDWDYKVESYEFCPFQEKIGLLGEHCVLKINCIDCNKKKILMTFFTKTAPSTESIYDFVIETGTFYKECRIYEELLPQFLKNGVDIIQHCVPNCYLVSDMNYLIFEDLASKGYKTINQRESMNLECVKCCLKTLAKFHASGLIFEKTMSEKTDEVYVLSEKFPNLFKESFYSTTELSIKHIEAAKKGIQTQIEMFQDASSIDISLCKELACKAFDEFFEIVKPSYLYRNTICHGDLWASNIMFKFENGQPIHCYLIDFQSYRYCPPAQDFLSFVYLSTDRQFRQKYMEEMKKYYYQQLTEILNQRNISMTQLLPYSEFLESCDYYKTFCITQAINHFQLNMANPDDVKALFTRPDIVRKGCFEDKSVFIVKFCEGNSAYRQKMLEGVIDLRENFIEKGLIEFSE